MTDQTTATLPATDQATFSRTGLLFGALCLVALIAPLVHVKPNRILAGEGLALPLALNAPIGWVISATLLALTAATLSRRRRAMQLVGLALIGLGLTILSLGLAARQLSPEGNAIIRIAPGWGFWLLVLVFAMMLVDALARVRLALRWRLAALVLGTGGLLSLLTSGWFDHVSVMVEYHLRQDMFRDSLHQHVALAFGSLALALCVGVPLGVAAHAFRRLGGPLLAGLNIIQTIPSMALFGILIAPLGWIAANVPLAHDLGIRGIGMAPAFVALYVERGRIRPSIPREALFARHELCEDLSVLLVERARGLIHELGLAEEDVLQRVHQGLLGEDSPVSAAEAGWTVGRLAEHLGWEAVLARLDIVALPGAPDNARSGQRPGAGKASARDDD